MSYGGSTGSSRIATAADAALSNPLNSDVLTYNSTLQKWVNKPFNTVNGVTVSGAPTTGQSLVATSTTTATWQTVSSGAGTGNIDGGTPTSTYGGTTGINGGTP